MKKLLAIAVAAALVAPAAAMAETTLYGKLHASYGQVKDNAGNKRTGVESHASRIGIKGSHALNNGLEATYGLEYGINLDGDNGDSTYGNSIDSLGNTSTSNSNGFTSRNQFVGLKGGFGEVRVGKHDTPAKLATAGQDVFADTYADLDNMIVADGHRVNNAVAYINKFGPVGFAVAHSSGTGLTGGAGTNGDNSADANSAMVNYGNGPWYAGLGYTQVKDTLKGGNLGLGWKSEAGHQANLIYEKVDYDAPATGDDKNILVNGVAKMGAVGLKAQYGEGKTTGAGKEKLASVGLDYSLGKKTSVYLLHSQDKNPTRVAGNTDKVKATAVGLVTEF
ncbi:MAG: porin [Candidatus Thiocaldithrix dubininis]|uniref:Porin n=1 Tax=Candidatus Thiocaldithrix dubininis TaxID=3080823 RepID=A0AA95H8R2_9GAMM|nr:MAG: porin [Candidatus Thiocaldithrix dubininis]